MTMRPTLRKMALTAHVISSVGWLGAVAAFLALSITGLISSNAETVRGAYVAARVVTWSVIVPLSLAALLTGLIQSLGTTWGLFRHYWVLIKLLLTVAAGLLLLLHTRPIDYMADAAALSTLSSGDLRAVRTQLIFDAALGLAALLVATILSIFKPRGFTPYGYRRRQSELSAGGPR